MIYLVKNGEVISKSENRSDIELVWEPGCEVMDQFPPANKRWDGSAWVLTEDAQAEADVQNLKDKRAEWKEKVNVLCYIKIVSGFTCDALEEGEPYFYQSEPIDQTNMQGMLGYALTLPDTEENVPPTKFVVYRCRKVSTGEDAFRPHTKEQFIEVFNAGKDRLLSLLQRAKVLKEAIDLAPTPEEVEFIDIESGW